MMIVFNLVNEIDVEATNEKVKEYKTANKRLIRTNKLKMEEEARLKQAQEQMKLHPELQQEADGKTFDQNFNTTPLQNLMRLPKPKTAAPLQQPKHSDDPGIQKRRMNAGGYKVDYPLLRARFEADQTVF